MSKTQLPLPPLLEALPRLGRAPLPLARPSDVYPHPLRSEQECFGAAAAEGMLIIIVEEEEPLLGQPDQKSYAIDFNSQPLQPIMVTNIQTKHKSTNTIGAKPR